MMKEKKENPNTLQKFQNMWNLFYRNYARDLKNDPWITKVSDILMDLNSARLERIYSSWESLGFLSWVALILGGSILLIFLLFFGTENIIAHFMMNSLFIIVITFMVFVIYALDNPFRSPYLVKPTAYKIIYSYHFLEPKEGIKISPEDIPFL